ncbi:s-cell enriched with leucine-rich repeat-containing protein slra-related [Anaeramoeba flamelloides]|uniref:S-cell enriched with leucine-rich repeat-containing protein slra-related n=1 Tax=Anaeramoeba flamelloides TaxID=1746091 RepID=A0AAV7ZHH9_9EUKA|nr:s-cell enriched with leucine-rich repeat-containing protein slra-related [Anaeramoeba flamelloides]
MSTERTFSKKEQKKQKKILKEQENRLKKSLREYFQSQTKAKDKKVDLSDRYFASLPLKFSLKGKGVIDWWRSVTELDLSNNKLRADRIPNELEKLTSLHSLQLHHNLLSEFPMVIIKLINLRFLGLSHNQIETIPREISHLNKLYGLSFSHNRIREFGSLCQSPNQNTKVNNKDSKKKKKKIYSSLRWLSLDHNKIMQIPAEIKNLYILESLLLRHNMIRVVPPEIGSLKALRELYLSKNNITTIPPQISQLSSLQVVDLSNNQISSLPKEMDSLNLDFFGIARCFLKVRPKKLSALCVVDDGNPYLKEPNQKKSKTQNKGGINTTKNKNDKTEQNIKEIEKDEN